jgi:hypothetical protein
MTTTAVPVALLWPLWPGRVHRSYRAYLLAPTAAGVMTTARGQGTKACLLQRQSTEPAPSPPEGRSGGWPHEFRSGSCP